MTKRRAGEGGSRGGKGDGSPATIGKLRRARQAARAANAAGEATTRRDFLKLAGVAGASLGLAGVAGGAEADPSAAWSSADPRGLKTPKGGKSVRTLFFNLSHLPGASSHSLFMGGIQLDVQEVLEDMQPARHRGHLQEFHTARPHA